MKPKTEDGYHIRVSSRTNEIQAGMHTQVCLLTSLRLLLLSHIRLMLVVDEFDNGGPRVTVVDVVTESRRVNDSKLDFELFLFKLGLDDLNLCKFVELLVMAPVVVFRGGEFG